MSKVLLNSIEQNLDNFYLMCSNHSNFESFDSDKLKWVRAIEADWPDCIFYANFKSSETDFEIERIKKSIQSENAPNGWTVGPLSYPKNLGKSLLDHNF